jgi:hypothetical protein
MFEFTHMYSIDEIIPGLFYLAMSVAMALSLSILLLITVNRKISITMLFYDSLIYPIVWFPVACILGLGLSLVIHQASTIRFTQEIVKLIVFYQTWAYISEKYGIRHLFWKYIAYATCWVFCMFLVILLVATQIAKFL